MHQNRILRTGLGDSDDKERNENKYNRIHFKYSGRKVCAAILHSHKCIVIVMKSLQQKQPISDACVIRLAINEESR